MTPATLQTDECQQILNSSVSLITFLWVKLLSFRERVYYFSGCCKFKHVLISACIVINVNKILYKNFKITFSLCYELDSAYGLIQDIVYFITIENKYKTSVIEINICAFSRYTDVPARKRGRNVIELLEKLFCIKKIIA